MIARFRTLLALGIAALLVGSAAHAQASLDDILESGTIRIATANEIPYGWINEQGEAQGIAPEVALAVLERLGVENVEWTVTEFGSLIPGLIANRFDMVAASQAILPDRCEQVLYSIPNSSYGEGLLVQAGNPEDIHSYTDFVANPDLTLGIVSGADQIDFAQAIGIPQDQITLIATNTDALSAVATGRIDAYAATGLTVARLAEESERVEAAQPFEDPIVDGEPVRSWGGFTFNQGSEELQAAFNEELAAFQETDEWRQILMNYGLTEGDIEATLSRTTEELCSPVE